MDTWKMAKMMSESVKTVFNAVTTGPEDAVKFGEKSYTDKPAGDCNTKHEIQGFRTIGDKNRKRSFALTDFIIVDFRGRDTNDCDWKLDFWNTDCSYNTKYSPQHGASIAIVHEDSGATKDDPTYSFEISGVNDGVGWVSSQPYLITEPGTWKLYAKNLKTGDCGDDLYKNWKKIGEFTAQEPVEDCFYQGRKEGANVGECGECREGFEEVRGSWGTLLNDGKCIEIGSDDSQGSQGNGTTSSDSIPMPYLIGGGLLLTALIIRNRRRG